MIAISKKLLGLAFLAALIFSMAGCGQTPIQANSLDPMPQFDPVEESEGCQQLGELFTFSVLYATPNTSEGSSIPAGMEYRVYFGQTAPYSLEDECLCRMQFVRLEFNWLPIPAEIKVYNANLAEISYEGPSYYNGHQAIKLPHQALSSNVYVDFTGESEPNPMLLEAGGYCIVDNISGERHPGIRTTIYEESAWDDILQLPYTAYFAPMSYTTGIVPP